MAPSAAGAPLISVVMPAYETPPRYLRAAVRSVLAQTYGAWQLVVVDDGSRRRPVRAAMPRAARADRRVELLELDRNRGISAATNAGLERCRGEYVAFLDHDDVLTPDALARVAETIAAEPAVDVVYTDSDKLDLHGRRADPFRKPDWSPTYALGAMYIGHLLVVRRSLALEAGGLDPQFDTIQDFEFMLRISERTERIHHLPEILYHWRAIPGSIAAGTEEKPGIPELQARAVSAHLARIGAPASATPHESIPHRARLEPKGSGPSPAVSVIVLSRGDPLQFERLLRSLSQTAWPALEVIVVGLDPPWPRVLVAGAAPRVLRVPGPTFSRARAVNSAAAEANGDVLVILSEEVEVPGPDWLRPLLLHLALPGVAGAAPLMVRPDDRVDSAGFAIGLNRPVVPILEGVPADGDGYYGSLPCARDVSALGGDCLAVDAEAFRAAGGLRIEYRAEYDDFDLSLRLRQAGHRLVYTPRPRVISRTTPAQRARRSDPLDRALFVDSWYDELDEGDPYYHRAFLPVNARYVL